MLPFTAPVIVRRRLHVALLAAALLLPLVVALPAAAKPGKRPFPNVIALPDGFEPEGIVIAPGGTAYAGSLADGTIIAVELRTGTVTTLFSGDDSPAVGLTYDHTRRRLYVAGGPTGTVEAIDTRSGMLVERETLPSTGAVFINDLVIADGTLWATDSFGSALFAIELTAAGFGDVDAVPLGGDFEPVPNQFNLNGIEATPNGDTLIVVQSSTGDLFTVDANPDADALAAEMITLGGADVRTGDGILLVGRTLYVVQNRLNQIAEIRLGGDLSTGRIVDLITSQTFDVPTTIDRFGNRLYAVNARFGTPPTPDTEYTMVAVRR